MYIQLSSTNKKLLNIFNRILQKKIIIFVISLFGLKIIFEYYKVNSLLMGLGLLLYLIIGTKLILLSEAEKELEKKDEVKYVFFLFTFCIGAIVAFLLSILGFIGLTSFFNMEIRIKLIMLYIIYIFF